MPRARERQTPTFEIAQRLRANDVLERSAVDDGRDRRAALACGRNGEIEIGEALLRVRIRVEHELDARRERLTDVGRREVQPVGQAVHLDRDALIRRNREHLVQVERILGTVVEDPPLRMAERADRGMAHRLRDHARELGSTPPLTGVQAELHPLELREHLVLDVE